jgi:hypothetical protein
MQWKLVMVTAAALSQTLAVAEAALSLGMPYPRKILAEKTLDYVVVTRNVPLLRNRLTLQMVVAHACLLNHVENQVSC